MMNNKYNLAMRIMHWLLSLMIITALLVGNYMSNLPDGAAKWQLYTAHKSFGLIILALVTIRIAIRFYSVIPAIPETIKPMEAKASSASALLLYSLMVLMPLSGYIMVMMSGRSINFFGMINLPNLLGISQDIASIAWRAHGVIGSFLIIFIVIHILAAIKHLLVEKVNLFKRMI